jgi:heme exporter protein C
VTGTVTVRRVLGAASLVLLALTAVLALWVSPADAEQGDAMRLLYLHVPAAWLAYLAFGVTALASLLWLWPRTRSTSWDLLAGASAEIGVLFTGLTLVMGSLWGKPIWGTWWQWDARLTTTAVLFFLYLGYLALRRTADTAEARGKRCAIAALIAFADVPIVHFSVTWWQTLHQTGTVFNPSLDVEIHGTMALTLVCSVVAFTLLYLYLTMVRVRIAELDEGRERRELDRLIAERIADRPEPALTSH